LRGVWVTIIDNILYTDLDGVPMVGYGARQLREAALMRLLRWKVLPKVFETLEQGDLNSYDRADYEQFFSADPMVRERFARLVSSADIQNHDISETMNDLRGVVEGDDVLSILILVLLLTIRGFEHIEPITSPKTNPIIQCIAELLDLGIGQEQASPSVPYLFITLAGAGSGYKAEWVDAEYISLFEKRLERYYRLHSCMARKINGHEAKNVGFGGYSQVLYLHDPNRESQLIDQTIDDAIRKEKGEFLRRYILDVGDYSSGRHVWGCLNGLRPLISKLGEIENLDLRNDIRTSLIAALSRIHIYAPIEVDVFLSSLSEQDKDIEEMARRVRAGERKEAIGGTMQGRAAFLIRDTILLNPDRFLLNQLIWWLQEALNCGTMAEWVGTLVKLMMNLIFLSSGRKVFNTPDLLPRRLPH
jgi:hypothetical protein